MTKIALKYELHDQFCETVNGMRCGNVSGNSGTSDAPPRFYKCRLFDEMLYEVGRFPNARLARCEQCIREAKAIKITTETVR